MAIRLRALRGKALLRSMLRRTELAIRLFITELEQGSTIIVPKELS